MKKLKVTFIDNCSHGYYSVSKKDFLLSGLKPSDISGYSGMTLNRVYLEEDGDASLFFNTCKANGIEIDLKRSYNPKFAISHNYNEKLFNYVPMVGDVIISGKNRYFIKYVTTKMLIVCTDWFIKDSSRTYRIPMSNLFRYIDDYERKEVQILK